MQKLIWLLRSKKKTSKSGSVAALGARAEEPGKGGRGGGGETANGEEISTRKEKNRRFFTIRALN